MQGLRHRGRAGWVGALLLCLFVLGQLHAGAHHAFVRHAECSASGNLVHLHGVGAAHATCSADHDDHETGPSGPSAEDPGEAAHGDVCSVFLAVTTRRGLVGDVPVLSRPAARAASPATIRSQTFGSVVPVYRDAPKQSPPRFV